MSRRGDIARRALAVALITMSMTVAAETSDLDRAIATGDYRTAQRLLDHALARDPDNPELRFGRARNLGRLGSYEAALQEYSALRDRYPQDVDYAFGRAQVLAWMQRDSDALAELHAAASMAPDYEAVWRLLFAVQTRQTGPDAEQDLEELRRRSAARFPDANWWRADPAYSRRQWLLQAGAAIDVLNNGLPDWDNQFVEIRHLRSEATAYHVRLARNARFDEADYQFAMGGEWRTPGAWIAGIEIGIASSPVFQPESSYDVHVGRSLPAGWGVDLRYRRREYPTATIGSLIAMAEKYHGDFRFAYSLGVTHLHGASNSLSHTATLNWYRTERSSFGLSVTTGDEAEAISPGQVLETDVRGVTVSGRHRVNDRVGLDWWAGIHDQGNFYRRHFVGVAVSIGI